LLLEKFQLFHWLHKFLAYEKQDWYIIAGRELLEKIPIISLAAEVCCIREAILTVLWQSVFAEVLLLFLQTQQLQFY